MLSSNRTATRTAGLLLFLVIPLTVTGVVVAPGLESRPEYFHESWVAFVPQHEQFALGNLIMLRAGIVAVIAALLLFQGFRRHGSTLVTGATFSPLAGGVLLAAGAAPGLRISQLASQWLTATGAAASSIERSALVMEQLRIVMTFLGLPSLLVGLLGWGVVIHGHSALPRWLKALPLVSGVIMLLSPLGFLDVLHTGFGGFLLLSALILFLWLMVEATWLVRHGASPRSTFLRDEG